MAETKTETMTITREWYDAFQRGELDRWEAIIADDVLINSPAGYGVKGLEVLKDWADNFARLGHRIDLVDEHLALDDAGNGRGFVTCQLHWKHDADFYGLAATGREGTSVESMIFTIENGLITRLDVADNTLDLSIYLWERGWPMPHNVRTEAIVEGVDREEE
jgi:ketosteroid isomerase-like protein